MTISQPITDRSIFERDLKRACPNMDSEEHAIAKFILDDLMSKPTALEQAKALYKHTEQAVNAIATKDTITQKDIDYLQKGNRTMRDIKRKIMQLEEEVK